MVNKSVLDNGIRVITEHIPGSHSVTLGIWVENGSRHEGGDQNGISHFIEHMLFKGTARRTALDIAKEIDSVGGVLNAFTSREHSCYYAKVLARKLPLAIDLLSDVVLYSTFDLDEIEKERRVILQEIFMVDDTPDDQIHDLFSQSFWKDDPIGLPILGNRDSVASLTRNALLDFFAERYCGNNIIICAAGDVDHPRFLDQIVKTFEVLPPGVATAATTLPTFHRQITITEKDLEQVHLCLGTRALPQNHPNRFASFLLNVLLGGSMSSRLFQKVREEQGLAYSIYSYLNCHSDTGAMVVYAGTSPEEARQVTRIILREMARFKDEVVSEEELHSAKEQLKGQLLLSLESTDARMTRLAKNELYLGRNPGLKEILHGFDRVTREDIQKLADFLLCEDYLNLQMIGRVKEFDFPLIDLTLG